MKSERKKIVANLDKIFSEFICARDKRSVFSGSTDNLQCFHIFSRISYSTRWDERNAVASTATENLKYEYDTYWQHQVHTWYIEKYGQQQFDLLYAMWNKTTKYSNADLMAMIEHYKKILKEGK